MAALAIGVAAACGGSDDPGTTGPQPIGGGGTTGGAIVGSPTGGGATTGATTGGTGATTGGIGATTGGVGGTTGGIGSTTGGVGGTTGGGTTGGGTTGGGTTGGGTTGGGTTGGGTTGGGNTMAMNFPGKAMGCSSYGAAMLPNKCAGYYCNISLAQLQPALGTVGKCTGFTAEDVCKGELTTHVGACAREQKSANPLDSNEVLRPKVEACVRAKRTDKYMQVTADCMACFLDAAQCAGDKCLLDCLVGDSKGCDDCRMKNNCNQPVPACGGLPNPF